MADGAMEEGRRHRRIGVLLVESLDLSQVPRVFLLIVIAAAKRRPVPSGSNSQHRVQRRRRLLIVPFREQHQGPEFMEHGVALILGDRFIDDVRRQLR